MTPRGEFPYAPPRDRTREKVLSSDSKVRVSIHRYFGEFGYAVGEGIYQELKKPGGMPRLLQRLGIPEEGDAADQYAMLVQYFRARGTKDFLDLVGSIELDFKFNPGEPAQPRKVPEPPEKAPEVRKASEEHFRRLSGRIPKLSETQTLTPRKELAPRHATSGTNLPANNVTPVVTNPDRGGSHLDAVTPPPYVPGAKIPQPEIPEDDPSHPYTRVDSEGFPIGPLCPGTEPDPERLDRNDPSWDPSKDWNPGGDWPDVERRSGFERRRKPDRRKEIDIVYSNRRFGGDRRSPDERRSNWPDGGHRRQGRA